MSHSFIVYERRFHSPRRSSCVEDVLARALAGSHLSRARARDARPIRGGLSDPVFKVYKYGVNGVPFFAKPVVSRNTLTRVTRIIRAIFLCFP